VPQQKANPWENHAFIALGSNLGDSVGILGRAFLKLQDFSGQSVLRSSIWQSTPVDCPPGSPLFANALAAFVPLPSETPESLLEKLKATEAAFGRKPKLVLNEPRPLDLDLIAFGREIRRSSLLTLPHPRAHQRRFVLQPLSEIAPDFRLPGQTSTVRELLEQLVSDEKLVRIA
jgi:2-amino-4-hydroxy-6-hydroxymethyldihydropteridine diphosphokinase